MRVQSQQNFQINLSGQHLAVILDGLAELPFKASNSLIQYIQQQMQHQLAQKAAVDAENAKAAAAAEIESEIAEIRREEPALAEATAAAANEG